MKLKQTKGNMYIEYSIIFIIVVGFCVLSFKLISNIFTDHIMKQYFSGKKVKLSITGLSLEKAGKYGGTKTDPLYVEIDDNTVALDFGYITLDNIPANIPKAQDYNNRYGSQNLLYFVTILEQLEVNAKYNP